MTPCWNLLVTLTRLFNQFGMVGQQLACPLRRQGKLRGGAVAGEEVIFNPYKGLAAFQESDAEDFFGREALTKRLLERLVKP